MKKGFILAKWPIIYAACHLAYLHVSQSGLKVLSLTANLTLTRSLEKGFTTTAPPWRSPGQMDTSFRAGGAEIEAKGHESYFACG
jgi:hypothetical protein